MSNIKIMSKEFFIAKELKADTTWLDKVVVEEKPIPHIEQKKLLALMPAELHPAWDHFIMGQTGLHCDNGDFGVYAWDFDRFAEKLRSGKKLKDTAAEFD